MNQLICGHRNISKPIHSFYTPYLYVVFSAEELRDCSPYTETPEQPPTKRSELTTHIKPRHDTFISFSCFPSILALSSQFCGFHKQRHDKRRRKQTNLNKLFLPPGMCAVLQHIMIASNKAWLYHLSLWFHESSRPRAATVFSYSSATHAPSAT